MVPVGRIVWRGRACPEAEAKTAEETSMQVAIALAGRREDDCRSAMMAYILCRVKQLTADTWSICASQVERENRRLFVLLTGLCVRALL